MKQRTFKKYADGGATTSAGPSSNASFGQSPSSVPKPKRLSSADALRYFRATGDRAGADEILKSAVGKAAKIPEAFYDMQKSRSAPTTSPSAGSAPSDKPNTPQPVIGGSPAPSAKRGTVTQADLARPEVRAENEAMLNNMARMAASARSAPQPEPYAGVPSIGTTTTNTPGRTAISAPPQMPSTSTPSTSPNMRVGPTPPRPMQFAKGGVTRADGCAQRGKTRGMMR
jgi:hypothetical protein